MATVTTRLELVRKLTSRRCAVAVLLFVDVPHEGAALVRTDDGFLAVRRCLDLTAEAAGSVCSKSAIDTLEPLLEHMRATHALACGVCDDCVSEGTAAVQHATVLARQRAGIGGTS